MGEIKVRCGFNREAMKSIRKRLDEGRRVITAFAYDGGAFTVVITNTFVSAGDDIMIYGRIIEGDLSGKIFGITYDPTTFEGDMKIFA